MAFVLDASVTACWAFDDEDHPQARIAFQRIRTEDALVPSLWWFEVRNILIVKERRQRITEATTAAFLSALARLPIREDDGRDDPAVLRIARSHRLTVYDSAYLELAHRRAIPLATLDHQLQKAAAEIGVAVVS